MSDLDQILARARAPGAFVERRRFSLNRQQAIEKLRAFSLRRPGQAVLELVQSAVHAGATYIAIDTSPEQLVVAWVGAPAIRDVELEHLFDFLFTDRGDRRRRHLVQLALATNALLRSGGRSLRIVSGDGTQSGTVRLEVEPDGSGRLGEPDQALSGTFVALDRKIPWWSIFGRTSSGGLTEEQVLVEEQCRHTPVPILLNGSAPFGYRATREIRLFRKGNEVSFDEGSEGRRGTFYLTERESRVDFVVGGVRICSMAMPELGVVRGSHLDAPGARGFSGIICDDDLRKTADQGDIVRDERFGAMLRAVRPHLVRAAHQVDSSWVPPALLSAETSPSVDTADDDGDLLARYPQLPPRHPLPLRTLLSLGEATPLFRVAPGVATVRALLSAADPVRLPWPVLQVSAGQAAALEDHLGRTITPLPDAGAAAMVARVHAAQGVVSAAHGSRVDRNGWRWRAHVHAKAVPLGLAPGAAMMVLVRYPSVRPQLMLIDGVADVPGFLAEVEVTSGGDVPSLADLQMGVLSGAVRLALESPFLPTATRARLLARTVRVNSRSSAPLELELPPGWTVEVPGPSLQQLAAAVTTGQPVVVEPAVAHDLWPLEEVVGVGALHVRGEEGVVAAVAWQDDAWSSLAPVESAAELLELLKDRQAPALVAVTSPPYDLPDDWRHPLPTSDPLVQWVGPGQPSATPDAARALHQVVVGLRDSASPRRAAARQRAELALARWAGLSPVLARPQAARALAGGPVSEETGRGGEVSWALARTGGWLGRLALPDWATPKPDPARFLLHRSFGDGAWLALPRSDAAGGQVQALVVVDDGVVRRLVAAPIGFPVCGQLPIDAPLARHARSLWHFALSTNALPLCHPWARRAAKFHPPDSLFLRKLLPDEPRRQKVERSPYDALDSVAEQALESSHFLLMQRDLLRSLLGKQRYASAPTEDDHLGDANSVVAPRTNRLLNGG